MDGIRAILADEELCASDKLRKLIERSGNDLEAMVSQFPSSLGFYALAAQDEPLLNRLVHYFDLYREYIGLLVVQGIAIGEWRQVDPKSTAMIVSAVFE